MISFLSLLVISFMLTTLLGVKSYNILTLTVSRLGSSHFSPVPILFDIACILAGTITIPYNLLITKNSLSYVSKDKNKRLKWSFKLFNFSIWINDRHLRGYRIYFCRDIQLRKKWFEWALSWVFFWLCFCWICFFYIFL